jgi:chemotaxis signal transduction protein
MIREVVQAIAAIRILQTVIPVIRLAHRLIATQAIRAARMILVLRSALTVAAGLIVAEVSVLIRKS